MRYREEDFIEWAHELRKLETRYRTEIQRSRVTLTRLRATVVEYQRKADQKFITGNILASAGVVMGGVDWSQEIFRVLDQQADEERLMASYEEKRLEIAK